MRMAKGAPSVHYRMREVAAGVAERWTALQPQLNERTRRLAAAAESRAVNSNLHFPKTPKHISPDQQATFPENAKAHFPKSAPGNS